MTSPQQEMVLSWGPSPVSPPPPFTYKRASQLSVMNKEASHRLTMYCFPYACSLCVLLSKLVMDVGLLSRWCLANKETVFWEHIHTHQTHTPSTTQHVMAYCSSWPQRLSYLCSCGNHGALPFNVQTCWFWLEKLSLPITTFFCLEVALLLILWSSPLCFN